MGKSRRLTVKAGHRALGRGGRGISSGSSRLEVPAGAVGHHGRGVSLHGLAPGYAWGLDVTGVVFEHGAATALFFAMGAASCHGRYSPIVPAIDP